MSDFSRRLILDELAARKAKNPSYSLRALARDLGVNVTSLSLVLAERRLLSKQTLTKIAAKLELSPVERQALENDTVDCEEELLVKDDIFKMMSDWYYFAILSLAKTKKPKSEPAWIARRLGISEEQAESAVRRLERLGYIECRGERLVRTVVPLRTTHDVPSDSLRKYHKQNLKLAERSIDEDPVNLRDISSTTMPIDLSKLPQAKAAIGKFRKKMAKLLTSGGDSTEVYTIAVQLYPVTRRQT